MKKILMMFISFIAIILLLGCNTTDNSVENKVTYNFFHNELGIAKKKVTQSYVTSEKYGYFDKNGEIVIDFIYDSAMPFNKGLAVVKKDEKCFLINIEGQQVTDSYDYLNYDYDNNIYIAHNDNSTMCILSEAGVIKGNYLSLGDFNNGIAVVGVGTNNYGYIDNNCNLLASGFYRAQSFSGEFAVITDENHNKWTIDKNMNKLYNFETQSIQQYGKYVIICGKTEGYKIFDVYGNLLQENSTYNMNGLSVYGAYEHYCLYGHETGRPIYNFYAIDSDKVVKKAWRIAQVEEYLILYFLGTNELCLYDNKLNLRQTIKTDKDCLIYMYNDVYRNDVYLKISNENRQFNYYMFDRSANRIKKVEFLDEYDSIYEIYSNYMCVKKKDLYGLIDLNGNIIFDVKSPKPYIATTDGYIFDSYNKILYDNHKKIIFQKKDWTDVVVKKIK